MNGRASGSSVRGSSSDGDKAPGEVFRDRQAVAGQDHESGGIQWHHLRPAEQPYPGRPFGNCARQKVRFERGVVQVIEE